MQIGKKSIYMRAAIIAGQPLSLILKELPVVQDSTNLEKWYYTSRRSELLRYFEKLQFFQDMSSWIASVCHILHEDSSCEIWHTDAIQLGMFHRREHKDVAS